MVINPKSPQGLLTPCLMRRPPAWGTLHFPTFYLMSNESGRADSFRGSSDGPGTCVEPGPLARLVWISSWNFMCVWKLPTQVARRGYGFIFLARK